MTAAIPSGGFPARPRDDRNAFLIFVGLVWVGVLSGFGTNSFNHISKHGLDYPPIVHVHAVAFVSWLVLFTAQVLLIRSGRADLHRKLGVWSVGLMAIMAVIGPATAIVIDAGRYAADADTPEFLAVQFADIIAFVGMTGAGLLLRNDAAAHKRLVLLGLIYISGAGFSRFLNPMLMEPFMPNPLAQIGMVYFCSDLLMLGLGGYDLVSRKRLHPAYVGGVLFSLVLQASAVALYFNPVWKALSLRIIGH